MKTFLEFLKSFANNCATFLWDLYVKNPQPWVWGLRLVTVFFVIVLLKKC